MKREIGAADVILSFENPLFEIGPRRSIREGGQRPEVVRDGTFRLGALAVRRITGRQERNDTVAW